MGQQPARTSLIVDDGPSFLRAMALVLRRQGYTVATAGNGTRAWEHIQATRYDVILVDIRMPELDGKTFYVMPQLYDPGLCSRVMFLTGDDLGDTTRTFLEQCGRPGLYKPCGAAEVLEAIEQVRGVPQ